MDIIKEVDKKAEELKQKILNSKTEIKPCGKVYYVANNGDDNNDGLTPETAWATLSKVNSAFEKDNKEQAFVCFRRGDIFRGQLVTASNVTYTAFGDGAKPELWGSDENGVGADKWIKVENTENVWRYYLDKSDIGALFFNETDEYAVRLCPNIVGDKFEFGYEALEDMQFVWLPDAEKAKGLNNNTFRDIKGPLYLRCDKGNPGEVFSSIEFCERFYLVVIPYHSENIVIDNLSIKYGGAHGVGGGFIKGLLVQNCHLAYIGGGYQCFAKSQDGNTYRPCRYGNAVELHSQCDGYTVQNCWIHDIYDTGVTHQQGDGHGVGLMFKDVSYVGNLIENCVYLVEYFACSSKHNGAPVLMANIRVADNILRRAGYGFGIQRTAVLPDWNCGACIQGWFRHHNLSDGNFIIENNIMDRALYSSPDRPIRQNTSLVLTAADAKEWLPIYRGNTYICEKGNQFAYNGVTVEGKIPFAMAEEGVTAESALGDSTGKLYIV